MTLSKLFVIGGFAFFLRKSSRSRRFFFAISVYCFSPWSPWVVIQFAPSNANSAVHGWFFLRNFSDGSSKEGGVKCNFWLPSRNFSKSKSSKYKFNRNCILLTKYTVSKPTVKIRWQCKFCKSNCESGSTTHEIFELWRLFAF